MTTANLAHESLDMLSMFSKRREEGSLVLMEKELSVLDGSRLNEDREEARILRTTIQELER